MSTQVIDLFNKVSSLTQEEQNNLAFFWSEDLANETLFDQKLSNTVDKLSTLAEIALNEFKQGKTIKRCNILYKLIFSIFTHYVCTY